MDVTAEYLNTFATRFKGDDELFGLEPKEIALNSYEKPAGFIITTDIAPEEPRASQLHIIYRDENLSKLSTIWEYKFDKTKTRTFVIPKKDENDIDTVGYEFEGLISPADCRRWYRNKWGY